MLLRKVQKFCAKWFPALFVIISLQTMVFAPPAPAATSVTLTDADALVFNRANGVTNLVGTGTSVNDVVLYKNIGTFGGVAIDAVITTVALSGSITNYDNPGSASTATGSANNWMINTVGGYATFKFEFFQSSTYKGANTGIPVILQNVKITSIDIDTSGSGAYQYSDFTGFQKYSLMSPTNLAVKPVTMQGSSTPGVRFIANVSGSRSSVPEDQVLVKYDAIQSVQMTFGNVTAGSTNYFGLVFGGWPGSGLPTEYPNVFNTPPTSSDTSQYVTKSTTTLIPLSSFGNFADADNNPFVQVKIASVSAGTLQYTTDGSTWSNVTTNQVLSAANIDKGYLRYSAGASGSPTVSFYVNDGLDFSTSAYTLTLNIVNTGQTISFANPGSKTATGTFASGATASSGLTVTLTSNTTGICTVSGLDITTLTSGTCSVTATQVGNATYSAALPVTQNFVIAIGGATSQTITFANPGQKQISTTAFNSNAKASSGLPVTLTSSTTSICTVSGLLITAKSAGNCTIVASQPGDTTYSAALDVTQTFAVVAAATTPYVWTTGAKVTSKSTVTFTGLVDPNGASTTFQFCYSQSKTVDSSGILTSSVTCTSTDTVATSVTAPYSVATNKTSLSQKTYYYQIVGYHNSSNKVYGEVFKFTLYDASNVYYLTTNAQSSLSTSGATLNGTGKSSSSYTAVSFCLSTSLAIKSGTYGALATCDQNPSVASSITKDSTYNATKAVTGLKSFTPYYYQLIFSYRSKSSSTSTTNYYGNIVRFVTNADPTTVTTLPATSIQGTSATFNGNVKANGPSTNITFCYGTSAATTSRTYGNQLNTCTSVTGSPSTASGTTPVASNYSVSGLTSGSTYYYQIVASNTINSTTYTYYGSVVTLITGTPAATTLAPSSIAQSSGVSTWEALLNGYVNTNGADSDSKFCYGTTSTVTNGVLQSCTLVDTNQGTIIAATDRTKAVDKTVTGLTAGTTYYYQTKAINHSTSSLYSYGEVLNFFTGGAPTVTTDSATSLSDVGATLTGTITHNGITATGTFCISKSNANVEIPGILDTCFLTLTGTVSGTASQASTTGLTNATTYYYQAIATNSMGTAYGVIKSFTTNPGAPSVTTKDASAISSNSATLNGTISPGGAATTATFCYLQSATVPSIAASGAINGCTSVAATPGTINVVDGETTVSKSLTVTTGNTYYFQVVGANRVGSTNYTSYGAMYSFTVGAPIATTNVATSVGNTSATLNGQVNSGAASTTAKFCISTSEALEAGGSGAMADCYGGSPTIALVSATTNGTITSGNTVSIAYNSTGLTAGNTYYFQVVANNSYGTSYGSVLNFMVGAPVAVTSDPSNVTAHTVTLNGTIDPNNNANVTGNFCISLSGATDPADGSLTTCVGESSPNESNFVGDSALDATLDVTGLEPGTTYYYQLSANGSNGLNFGSVKSFETFHEVIFDANGGSGTIAPQISLTTQALTTNSFTRSGYEFNGWNTSSNGSGTSYSNGASYPFTANATMYAKWLKQYVVTFDPNSADGGIGSLAYETSTVATTLTANTFTHATKFFAGWNTAANGSGTAYSNGATYAFTSDTTLYAQWTSTIYTLTFQSDPSHGATGTAPTSIQSSGNVTLPADGGSLARTGYRVTAWDLGGSNRSLGSSYSLSANETATAVWTRYYTITFSNNSSRVSAISGSASKTTDEYIVGGSGVVLATVGTMAGAGYSFAGWGATSDTTTVLSSPVTVDTDTVLYAIWTALSYSITYDGNSADSGSVPANTTGYGTVVIASNTGNLEKSGKSFAGWTIGSTEYATGDSYALTADVTATAIWRDPSTVTFDANTGSGSMSTLSSAIARSLTLNSFTKTNYSFSGWTTNADGTGDSYDDGESYPFTSSVTLYAQWTIISYTVTYDANGGSVGSSSETFNSGDSGLTLPTPTRSGYTFNGWYTSSNAGTKKTSPYTPSGNITLYAQWSANSSSGSSGGGSSGGGTTPVSTPTSSATPTASASPTSSKSNSKKVLAVSIPLVTTNAKTANGSLVTLTQVTVKASPSPTPSASKSVKPNASSSPSSSAKPSSSPSSSAKPSSSPSPSSSSSPRASASASSSTSPSSSPVPSSTPSPIASASTTPITTSTPKPSISTTPTSNPTVISSSTPTSNPTSNATLEVVNSSEVTAAKVVSVGTGVAQISIVNNTVAVTPTSGFSGKTQVVVQVTQENAVTTVKVPVTVLPQAPVKPIVDPQSSTETKIDWNPSPNAVGYQVLVDGKIACVTSSSLTECSVPQLLGPKSEVQVISRGGSLLKSDPVPAVYTNKDPIVAGLVNFANNSYVLTSSEKAKLRELATTIKEEGFTNVLISGHTDPNTGVDNQTLSENRAKATAEYLQKFVPKLTVKVQGFAATQRTGSGNDEIVYANDRRAEIKVW